MACRPVFRAVTVSLPLLAALAACGGDPSPAPRAPDAPSARPEPLKAVVIYQSGGSQRCYILDRAILGTYRGNYGVLEGGRDVAICAAEGEPVALPAGTYDISEGPIRNNDHAGKVCPAIAGDTTGRWTGHWHTDRSDPFLVYSYCQVQIGA